MTTPGSDDRTARSDPRLDAAWRAASNEVPSAALDAAILAAARREAGAGPRSARAQMAMDVRRRWWPLAAAATIAAIAVGVLELVTPDQLAAPSLDRTTVSDMPPNAKPALDAMTAAPREEPATGTADNAAPAGAGGAVAQSGAIRQGAGSPRPAQRDDAAKVTTGAQRRASSGEAQVAAPASDAQRIPQPFPAATESSPPAPSATSQASGRAQEATSAPEATAQASATPPAPASLAASAQAPAAAAPAPARPTATSPGTMPSAARAPAAPGPAFASTPAPGLIGRMNEQSAPLAKTQMAGTSTDQAAERRAKDGTPLPIPAWIAWIRRLRAEGMVPEAAKELAAFRAAHADHEKLLPPDLRDWHPPTQ